MTAKETIKVFLDTELMSLFEDLLSLLLENKHFPAYQAERRIDIFINFFLEEVLKKKFGSLNTRFISPEFPLRTYAPDKNIKGTYRSTKVDYAYLNEVNGEKEIMFIELKTDPKSFDLVQYTHYLNYLTWPKCINSLKNIILHGHIGSREKEKYFHLVQKLVAEGLMTATESLPAFYDRNFNSFIKKVESDVPDIPVRILYVAPEKIQENRDWKRLENKPDLLSLEEMAGMEIDYFSEEWNVFRGFLEKLYSSY